MTTAICSFPDCGRPRRALGLCKSHWAQQSHGKPLTRITARLDDDQRFDARIDKHGPVQPHYADLGPCWIWTGARYTRGYGCFHPRGKDGMNASRFALERRLGRQLKADEIPRHRCDNPPCVNPDHLLPGTHADNAADMYARGRDRFSRERAQRAASP